MQIPGKEEFRETIRYFANLIDETGVNLKLNSDVLFDELTQYDEIIVSSGVAPRQIEIEGFKNDARIIDYQTLIKEKTHVGESVAVIGAGGIGIDIATMVTEPHGQSLDDWLHEWGIDKNHEHDGGLYPFPDSHSDKTVWVMQRKKSRVGKGPGKTTGWIHKRTLEKRGVHLLGGVSYEKLAQDGLHIKQGSKTQILNADKIVLCAGQVSVRPFEDKWDQLGEKLHVIGGAKEAGELDAVRAIRQGLEVAIKI
jgi:2,4-dienoyl-CoA reductase (NADPH2)